KLDERIDRKWVSVNRLMKEYEDEVKSFVGLHMRMLKTLIELFVLSVTISIRVTHVGQDMMVISLAFQSLGMHKEHMLKGLLGMKY
ncbi:hypothetical protein Lal_00033784, partial [Lupinus albus]